MGGAEMECVLWLITPLTLLADNSIYLSIDYIPGVGCCLHASSDLPLRALCGGDSSVDRYILI